MTVEQQDEAVNYVAAAQSGSAVRSLVLGVGCLVWGIGMALRNRRALQAAKGDEASAVVTAMSPTYRRILMYCGWVLAVCGLALCASGMALSLGAS